MLISCFSIGGDVKAYMRELIPHWKRVIVASGILFLGCLVGFVAYAQIVQVDAFWENKKEQLYHQAEDAQKETEDWLLDKTKILTVETVRINGVSSVTSEDCAVLLADFKKWDPEIKNVYVFYPEGISGTARTISASEIGFDTQGFALSALAAQGELLISEPYYDSFSKQIVVSLAQKTSDASGRTCVGAIEFSLQDITMNQPSQSGEIRLVSKEGKIIYSTNTLFLPVVVSGQPEFAYAWERLAHVTVLERESIKDAQDKHIQRILDYDEKEKYEVLTPIGLTDWTLEVSTPVKDLEGGLNELSIKQIPLYFLAVALSLLCCLAAAALILRDRRTRKEQEQTIEDLREENHQLSILSNFDTLTEVHNRRYLMSYMEKRLSHYDRRNPFCVLMLDLDHFKDVNDEYGHSTGDEVLKALSEETRTALRADDVFARHGGEEFIIVLEGVHAAQAYIIAERIRRRIEDLEIKRGIKVTVSIGVIEAREGDAVYDILDRVDVCMYNAKTSGRNRTTCENSSDSSPSRNP